MSVRHPLTATAVALCIATVAPQAQATRRPVPHPRPDPALGHAVDGILADPLAKDAAIGVQVSDGRTGERLYAHDDRAPLVPASNAKLRTSAAALDQLGTDYHFHTDLLARGRITKGVLEGSLTVKGFGDPTLRESDMESLALQLKSAGVRQVNGPLTVDATFFDDVRYHPDWDPADETAYYAGQVSALTMSADADLDTGTFILEYTPGSTPGAPVTTGTTPAVAAQYVDIDNRLTTGPAGSASTVRIVREHGTNHVVLTGSVPADDGATKEWVAVDDPALYSAAVLRAALGRVGVLVGKETRKAATPQTGRVLARDTSSSLGEILVPWMKLSNNPISEDIVKTMAAERHGAPGTWTAGNRIVDRWMRRNHVPMAGVAVRDGSGLARTNRLTADATSSLLLTVQHKRWFRTWYNALPVAGDSTRLVGGTLRNRMKDTPAAGNLHGKSGTLTGVSALSGYVSGADGRPYVFSMLSNYPGEDPTPRPLEDRVGVLLASWSRSAGRTIGSTRRLPSLVLAARS